MRAKRSSAARQAAGSRQQAVKTVTNTRRAVICVLVCPLIQALEQRLHLPLGMLISGSSSGCDTASQGIFRLVIVTEPHERLSEHQVGGHVVRAGGDQVSEMRC